MTTRIITVFLVDHPKIFNFLLDDPKISWDTWVTVVIQQTLPLADVFFVNDGCKVRVQHDGPPDDAPKILKLARITHEVLLARLLAGFLAASIRHPKIQNKTQKYKQQPPLCSVSLPHLHVPPSQKGHAINQLFSLNFQVTFISSCISAVETL